MPLSFAPLNVPLRIAKIHLHDDATAKHLASLGLVEAGTLTVLDLAHGCPVVLVMGSRLALDRATAMGIEVELA